ncbi:Glycerol kinase [Entomophthora muscae]|uniref:Glycerol kinase n=1 Tax=Entomophthora muscae TaxID=34485 RepID=A0ACC2RZ65_9FUNG|nr:Glycerol kinase [Entomophthora muscae]
MPCPKATFQPPFLGAIDQGTSSTRFIIFDFNGKVVAKCQHEFDQICPKAGWVEHDPLVILESVNKCIEGAVAKFLELGYEISEIKGTGITNQRETTVCWNKHTHEPLHNAIVWCDARTQELVDRYQEAYSKNKLQGVSGLPLSTYFSALKIRWMLENVPAVKEASENGTLLTGTIDSWLIYKFTSMSKDQSPVHVTDVSNASRTNLMNLNTLEWDEELLSFFDISRDILPEIRSSSEVYCNFDSKSPLAGVPLAGCLGDQQAAFVGQKCFTPGSAKNTYGTGCFLLFNTGEAPTFSTHGLISTVAFRFGKGPPVYALEGSIAVAGCAIQWLRDNLCIISEASEVGKLALQVPDTAGVHFVPAFTGLLAPYWRPNARGAIVGLTQYADKRHLARAALEAVCFQTRAILDAMNKDSGKCLASLKVDGGMAISDLCMQTQSDLLGIPVVRPDMCEASALGAAMAAGLATNVYKDIPNMLENVSLAKATEFTPKIPLEEREIRYKAWEQAIHRILD